MVLNTSFCLYAVIGRSSTSIVRDVHMAVWTEMICERLVQYGSGKKHVITNDEPVKPFHSHIEFSERRFCFLELMYGKCSNFI